MNARPPSSGSHATLRRAVGIVGAATAGSEVAAYLASRGVTCVVFERGHRPYGKIEDGLPRWHVAQRLKEYAVIDAKLCTPGVHFVPSTRVGVDVSVETLLGEWGLGVVVLACGAARDRPLSLPDADAYAGRGLVYQNQLVHWFNHHTEAGYEGPRYTLHDDAVVVGGGLASIDVAKILTLETTRMALAARGIVTDILDMEYRGIPATLEQHGLTWNDLGLRGCTVVYRRRIEDMPVVKLDDDAPAAKRTQVESARRRLIEKARAKYCFRVEPLLQPEALIGHGGELTAIRLRRLAGATTPIGAGDGPSAGHADLLVDKATRLVVGSIGSIPEPIEGIPMRGEFFAIADAELGSIAGMPHVFGAGNAISGKGNIAASRKHGTFVAAHLSERYLGLGSGEDAASKRAISMESSTPVQQARALAAHLDEMLARHPGLDDTAHARLLARVRERQQAVGYDDYRAWKTRHEPVPAAVPATTRAD